MLPSWIWIKDLVNQSKGVLPSTRIAKHIQAFWHGTVLIPEDSLHRREYIQHAWLLRPCGITSSFDKSRERYMFIWYWVCLNLIWLICNEAWALGLISPSDLCCDTTFCKAIQTFLLCEMEPKFIQQHPLVPRDAIRYNKWVLIWPENVYKK